MLRDLLRLRRGNRIHAADATVSAQAALEAREDYVAPRVNYGSINLRDVLSFGQIPFGVNDAKLPFERIAYGFCPGCGAPRTHERCEYCGGRHRSTEQRKPVSFDDDETCPRCDDVLNTVSLYGDNRRIATHLYCPTCGYQGGTR